tara:strand:- start:511 stop:690 length:180 start_codon:yes stop_codon:yes gene_type:complete
MTNLTKAVSMHTPKVATDISAKLRFFRKGGTITVLKPSLKGMPMKQRAIVRFREKQNNV